MSLLFSELWEQSEGIKSQESKEEMYYKLSQLFTDYRKLDNITSKEIQKTLKTKKYGEILYEMTQLSRIDDINTYAALNLELQTLTKEKITEPAAT